MLEKTKGIVLNHLKYGESSLISHIFTQDFGRKSFLIKAARSKNARTRSNLFQVMNILNIEFYNKESRELLLIKEVHRSKVFNSFPYDVIKSTQVMFIAEVLQNCIAEGDPDIVLFEFLENALEYFDLIENNYANFHLAFLMKLSRYLGIPPSLISNADNQALNINEAYFNGMVSPYIHHMSEENSRIMYELLNCDFEKISGISLSRQRRNNILNEILRFYTANGYNLKKIKTLPVLKELFL